MADSPPVESPPVSLLDGTIELSSEATYQVAGSSPVVVPFPLQVQPVWPVESGRGRIVHPTLGAFDYEVKPDEWVNIDGDVIVPPVWASTRTLTGAANVLWAGNIRDVIVEEHWKSLGGLSMPVTQLRMLILIFTNPVDPRLGYVQWYPNYISPMGFNVMPFDLSSGGKGIAMDDVVNSKYPDGSPDGWVTQPITFTMRIASRIVVASPPTSPPTSPSS